MKKKIPLSIEDADNDECCAGIVLAGFSIALNMLLGLLLIWYYLHSPSDTWKAEIAAGALMGHGSEIACQNTVDIKGDLDIFQLVDEMDVIDNSTGMSYMIHTTSCVVVK